jgi:hypothetical protein
MRTKPLVLRRQLPSSSRSSPRRAPLARREREPTCGGIANMPCDAGLWCEPQAGQCGGRRHFQRLCQRSGDLQPGVHPGLRMRWKNLWQRLRTAARQGAKIARRRLLLEATAWKRRPAGYWRRTGGAPFKKNDIVDVASFMAVRVGSGLGANKNAPRVRPAKNTATIAEISKPLLWRRMALWPTCFCSSSRSRWSIFVTSVNVNSNAPDRATFPRRLNKSHRQHGDGPCKST